MVELDSPETIEKVVNALADGALDSILETGSMDWKDRWYSVEKKLAVKLAVNEIFITNEDGSRSVLRYDDYDISKDAMKLKIRDRVYIELQRRFDNTPLFGICPYFKITDFHNGPVLVCSCAGDNNNIVNDVCQENAYLKCDKYKK